MFQPHKGKTQTHKHGTAITKHVRATREDCLGGRHGKGYRRLIPKQVVGDQMNQ